MTISKCVYGKVTKTNLVQRNSENLEKKNKRKLKKKKKWNTEKDKNFKRNTTNEENNPAIKREISRSGGNTFYRNN